MVKFNSFTNNKITKQLIGNVKNIERAKCIEGLSCFTRCFLAFLNAFPLLFAITLLAAGSGASWFYRSYNWPTTVDTLCIGLGLIIGVTAFFGFVGSVTESLRLLKWYVLTLVIIVVIQFIFSNILYVALVSDLIQSRTVVENILGYIYDYSHSYYILQISVTGIQDCLRCCGFSGPQDMILNSFNNITILPGTCCNKRDPDGFCLLENAYPENCVSGVDEKFPLIRDVVFYTLLMLGALQLICAALAYFVRRTVKKRTIKYERIPDVFTISSK